jgi:ankyrin repeat protein
MAAMFGHTGLVRLLLQKGADPTITSNDGETAADVAKGMVLANEIRNFKK